MHIALLFRTECQSGDAASAKLHGETALRFLVRVTDDKRVFQELITSFFNTTELVVRRLEKTAIQLDLFIARRLANFCTIDSVQLSQSFPGYGDVPSCVEEPIHRTLLRRLRFCLALGDHPFPLINAAQKARAEAVYNWLAIGSLHDMELLLNLYVNLIERKLLGESEGLQLSRVCFTFALLHMFRKCMRQAVIDGRVLRDASHVILPKLKEHLENALQALTLDEHRHYEEAILWVACVGAQASKVVKARRNLPTLEIVKLHGGSSKHSSNEHATLG